MGHWVGGWDVRKAVHVMDWDNDLDRDVSTLYVDPSTSYRDHSREQEVMQAFVDGVSPASSHWIQP